MTRVIGIFYEAIPSEMCRSWNSVGRLRVAYRQLEMKLATKTRPKQPAEDDPVSNQSCLSRRHGRSAPIMASSGEALIEHLARTPPQPRSRSSRRGASFLSAQSRTLCSSAFIRQFSTYATDATRRPFVGCDCGTPLTRSTQIESSSGNPAPIQRQA